ncbi:MAG: energy transducer TonB [Flavobacterium sp.]|nr:energy transducer TonB [Flavobacterium sp.]
MKKTVLIIFLIIANYSFSQDQSVKLSLPNPSEVIYTSNQVTFPPKFKGGKNALGAFIKRNFNVKVYKKGEILVAFIVEKDGKLSEVGVLEDAGKGTADEAIRVMNNSPKWKPGILNGNPVRVQFSITIPVSPN